LRLLEQITVCIRRREPALLVGETGTGKTTTVQYLARQLNKNLVVINMSQQSESSDLIGQFKPVDVRALVEPLADKFRRLFVKTFSRKQNAAFLSKVF
jgi:midasin